MLMAAPELLIGNSNSRGKIVQNIKFLLALLNSDFSSKFDSTSQNESRSMLIFQNTVLEAQKSKWHVKWCNRGLPRKMSFSIVARLEILKLLMDL